MQSNIGFNFSGSYHVQLIDTVNDVVKQEGHFHNILVNWALSILVGEYNSSSVNGRPYDIGSGIRVGNGTGTPKVTDRELFAPTWSINRTSQTYKWHDDNHGITVTNVYTFPATAEYVGTVTEIGLIAYAFNTICTHALLTDAEGHQISFNKTDLDVLLITVELDISMTSNTPGFEMWQKSYALRRLSGVYAGDSSYVYDAWGPIIYLSYYADLDKSYCNKNEPYNNVAFYRYYKEQRIRPTSTAANGVGTIKWPACRLETTDTTTEHFFVGVGDSYVGFFRLPNEEAFPAYPIKKIPVGTGDGITTEFECPIGYFKKDTDIIYIDDVPLVRGIDYTVNHINNHAKCPELTQLLGIPTVHSDLSSYDLSIIYRSFALPLINTTESWANPYELDPSKNTCYFTLAHPLFIEYPTEVTLNYFVMDRLLSYYLERRAYLGHKADLLIDYSTDGIDYVNLATIKDVTEGHTVSFEATTAKYWRIRVSSEDSRAPIFGLDNSYAYTGYRPTRAFFNFMYIDPNIKFTVPPAKGAKITMDVDMDILFKNDKFVIDYTRDYTFNIN